MKKSVVFVIPSLAAGGGEKSLINLLSGFDFNLYDVDLLLLNKSGIFLKLLPEQVNLVAIDGNYQVFTKGLKKSLLQFLKRLNLNLAINRLLFALKSNVIKNKAVSEQASWRNISPSIPVSKKKYDIAIGFLEKSSIYVVVEKITAAKKMGWIHTNYSTSGMNKEFDYRFFDKLDNIITVSAECAADLKVNFPDFSNKISVIHNIVSPKTIRALSEKVSADAAFDNSAVNIVTVGRLSPEKGIDIALAACRILVQKGLSFKWFVIGDGPERSALQKEIDRLNLVDHFILSGLKENPYPYIRKAVLYVQPSRYEGKSIAVDEAKILQKPIVVTDFDTAKDQIQHGHNGIISSMSPEVLALDIEKLLNDKTLRDDLSLHLSQENLGTEDQITRLYNLFNA